MNQRQSRMLIYYGIFLIAVGIAGYLSNPEKAKTAILSGGTFGSLSIFWGWLGTKQVLWSLLAARVTTVLLTVVFTWRSFVTWNKVISGAPEKTFAAALITSMLIASIVVIIALFRKNQNKI